MEDRYGLIDKAKQLIPFDELHKAYHIWLFLALRSLKCDLKQAVQIVLSNLKGTDIKLDYMDLYSITEEGASIGPENQEFLKSLKLLAPEIVENLVKNDKLSLKSNLSQLCWVETFVSRLKPPELYVGTKGLTAKKLQEVRGEIIKHPHVG